jgi:drug/metabolite transporter (DMT)-like permease
MQHNILIILGLIIISNVFDTARELFLKSAINTLGVESPRDIRSLIRFISKLLRKHRIYLSFVCSIFSLLFYLLVLSKADLNLAFSLDSIHYIFIAVSAKLILKEKVGASRWFGTLFVIIGIVLVTLS